MMREVPCRDTDPDPGTVLMDTKDEDRDSPVAFTINFGGDSNAEEKNRRLERLALRSSQRKPKSPRPDAKPNVKEQGQKSFLRDDSQVAKLRERMAERRMTRVISGKKEEEEEEEEDEEDYAEDSFEVEEDSEEEAVREEGRRKEGEVDSSPSETGTYTVDKETEDEPSLQDPQLPLHSLDEKVGDKSSYVAEWASKHAFGLPATQAPGSLPSPLPTSSSLSCKSRRKLPATPHCHGRSPEVCTPESSLSPPAREESEDESSYVTHTQHLVDVMEARINQKTVQKTEPKSVLNSSSNTKSKIARRMKSTGPAVKSGHDAGEPDLAAMEAWRRRKNYDPMAAAGKKKEVTRKHSGTSLTSGASKTGREAHTVGETGFSSSAAAAAAAAAAAVPSNKKLQPGSAPNSAVSRSSDSSGYLSRTDTSRQSGRGKATSTGGSRPAPLRKLVHTGSSSSLKMQASRSSSSLTSKEAEFQAWKRRKNYDPMKAAGRKSSSPATANTNRGTGGAQTKGVYGASATEGKLAPQHHRVRDMSQSLVMGGESNYPIHRSRSSSFHYPGKKTGGTQQTSEEDSGEDYGSGSSAAEGGRHRNHFYLDDDELILPIGRTHGSQARLQDRSLYGSTSLSPQISPSKSRSKQLEALDNLVISTIYNVSSKLCVASSNVLRKAITVLPEQEEEQASTVETVLYLLDDVDLPTTPAKKTSRELSGTLRNLKKVEQAIEMLNKVLEIEEEQ